MNCLFLYCQQPHNVISTCMYIYHMWTGWHCCDCPNPQSFHYFLWECRHVWFTPTFSGAHVWLLSVQWAHVP